MSEELRMTPMYEATNRVAMVFGCERELVLSLLVICVGVGFMAQTWVTTFISGGAWMVGTYFLRDFGKKDKMMSKVFVRYCQKYRRQYFSAASPPGAPGYTAR